MMGLKGLMAAIPLYRRGRNRNSFGFSPVFFMIAAAWLLTVVQTGAVTLAWDPNSETDIAGYRIYYGQTNTPAIMLDVGNTTSVTITNLTAGKTYFFYATAYNTAALESEPSDQVFYTVPAGTTNTSPSISPIADQTIAEDGVSGSIGFTITDRETPTASLTVQISSSNTNLVPTANLVVSGSGTNRTLVIRPATNQFGATTITMTVSDGSLSAQIGFSVTVSPINDLPTISKVGDQNISSGSSVGPLAFTVGDVETIPALLTVSAASSKPSLIPQGNIVLGGSGANRTVSLTAASGQSGTATITLNVSDGLATVSSSFVITVNAPPPPEPANLAIATSSSVGVTLRIQGVLGRSYTIEASGDLKTWTPIGTVLNTSGTATFQDHPTGNRFYRVMTQ